MKIRYLLPTLLIFTGIIYSQEENKKIRASDIGINVGVMRQGKLNSITDVEGVLVGHKTIIKDDNIRSGVTAILPHNGNIFQQKAPAAIYVFNGFGKLAGYTQVEELGNIESPIILTNTLNVGTAVKATVNYVLCLPGNEDVRSVNAVVGETNDGYLNDIRGMHVTKNDVLDAIHSANSGVVEEGTVGAGTGTVSFGLKGGIGTASRIITSIGNTTYTVGVLVQTNFGRELMINGIPYTREVKISEVKRKEDGSCMIVIATDAPLSPGNLKRLAKRAFIGMGRTTNVMSNGSGDYAIAFSTAYKIPHEPASQKNEIPDLIDNNAITILFQAVEEATQEAIYNSLFAATTVKGFKGRTIESISIDRVKKLLLKYNIN
ncbi:MAG: P1 family peptidase [Melioribacteraceae bacterium]|nr:P1 family peptidase [Melioribacteraceae bacterium]